LQVAAVAVRSPLDIFQVAVAEPGAIEQQMDLRYQVGLLLRLQLEPAELERQAEP
jgi:hypothetical protein